VTGGYVSRRSGSPTYGKYFFADYCSGRVWQISAGFSGGSLPAPVANVSFLPTCFGEDMAGRIYICDYDHDQIWRITNT
jgi:hypothetical protein